ncbi:DUF2380 domain-containing protein [Methyloglobulus sp.]|uniref:DUF2380 domain-containing protein n=1 Tax=Methyloglobulus sp. TaxID=2518622 RepID=UPI0032B71604
MGRNILHISLLVFLLSLFSINLAAQPRIAVLDFELKDLTLKPGVPEEIERTASVKPMLEEELQKSGYEIVTIPMDAQIQATSGVGYLFDHHDIAAQLAQKYDADYVIVGRLHKPSFLFVYLMAHLVDVKQQRLVADYLSEVKGGEKKLTRKGVESLVVKVNDTFNGLK